MQKCKFSDFGLSQPILDAVAGMGFEEASPIQSAAIPVILAGKDVVGLSQTGSGKTAAYAIPTVERMDADKKQTQVVVLCPTRELAVQVAEEFAKLTRNQRKVTAVAIYGGQAYYHQIKALKAGAQIVIATPGRLIDHLDKGTLDLSHVRTVILDEADRMLDMGFRDEMDKIIGATPAEAQKLFFSATMPKEIRDLIKRRAPNAERVEVEHKALTVPSIDQRYYEVKRDYKLELLHRLIDHENVKLGIIFCNTKKTVDDLSDLLQARGYAVDKLHGDITQHMRQRVLNKFKEGGLELLVATDVAARGIDVDDVDVVFNFDLPYDEEDYVHRIGRTGRAGRSGRAISLISGKEVYRLQQIIRYTKAQIRREQPPTLEEVAAKRMDIIFGQLRTALEEGKYPKCNLWIDRLLEQGHPATEMISALVHLLRGDSDNNDGKDVFIKAAGGADRGKNDRKDRKSPRDSGDPREPKGWPKLFINLGREQGIKPGELKQAITTEANVHPSVIGRIQLSRAHSLVEIDPEVIDDVIVSMRTIRLPDMKLIVRRDRDQR